MKYDHNEKAAALFTQGYNCAQSVFVAFSDMTGMDEKFAKMLSSSLGGGMGRLPRYLILILKMIRQEVMKYEDSHTC